MSVKADEIDLTRSVETLKSIKRDVAKQSSPKIAAQLYVAAIGLLYHLKTDQETLQRIRCGNASPKCPPSHEIPAISLVLESSELYEALLRCLTTSSGPSADSETTASVNNGNRKRSGSINNSGDATKFLKTTHSPIPSVRKTVSDLGTSPRYSVAALAAAILYAAFSHLDHWPASLVKVYADDTFGPRLWVDDPSCRLLVNNLELCHEASVPPSTTAEESIRAKSVASAFEKHSSSSAVRRESISSTTSTNQVKKRKRKDGGGDSSSSGEDEDDAVQDGKAPTTKSGQYPINQTKLNLEPVRQRYYGDNWKVARSQISISLNERLDVKSKQNSGLLQSLPSFTSIPKVRKVIASNLSKWLQSPALAGLARNLFSVTVNKMENADPPLPEDVDAIDSILSMRLKANQLNAHIENVTAVAKRIPTSTTLRQIYSKLIRDELEAVSTPSAAVLSETSNFMKMIGAVHHVVPVETSYDAIASTLLMMMAHPTVQPDDSTTSLVLGTQRNRLVFYLRVILRSIANVLASSFDGIRLLEAFFELDIRNVGWSPKDEEDKARLMFQCVTLAVGPYVQGNDHRKSGADRSQLTEKLVSVRKLLLSWFCSEYGAHHSSKLRKRIDAKRQKENAGAGQPDFRSILKPCTEEKIPSWLNTFRCLLFVEDPDSDLMKRFVLPDGTSTENEFEREWDIESKRIRLCSEFGVDVSDELLWIILKASKDNGGDLEPEMSMQLVENLVESCGKRRKGKIAVRDPTLIWELYNLAQYSPSAELIKNSKYRSFNDLPRLAYPDIWWRATVISLIFCGARGEIATVMWDEHPTLQSLLKMVTSSRYRFPTVDCDDHSRDKMKAAEQSARDEETRVAETLFLPVPEAPKDMSQQSGPRVSRRLLKQQQEKEAARALAEKQRRKTMLRAAQKSIMLWDPDGPARKPPRDIADLIVAVNSVFGLSEALQTSKDPDFLSMTIGNTTRSAVERAYDWLIPIVSKFPDTITRLPSSTTCFLLLRAYGTDGDERKQLKELAAPLLRHVQDSLIGRSGLDDCTKAFELLMSDVASQIPDRRRCARRVLNDSVPSDNEAPIRSGAWMLNILHLEFSNSIVPIAVESMGTAASFERGSVLRQLILSLQRLVNFAEKNNILLECRFGNLVVEVISQRPSAFAEVIDSYSDVRSLAVEIVYNEFLRYLNPTNSLKSESDSLIEVAVFRSPKTEREVIRTPLSLVRAISVFLSLWKDAYRDQEEQSTEYIYFLVNALLQQSSSDSGGSDPSQQSGALSVEIWIMMAKARSESIARRVALSAPASFLPRLLLCSGLTKSSLLTMVDRLGQLGDKSEDMEALYLGLLVPSASNHWDIGRLGHRRDISRRLLGRLSSYFSLHDVALASGTKGEVSTVFLKWLSKSCGESDYSRGKAKGKKRKVQTATLLQATELLKSMNNIRCEIPESIPEIESQIEDTGWTEGRRTNKLLSNQKADVLHLVEDLMIHNRFKPLEIALESIEDQELHIKLQVAEGMLRYVISIQPAQELMGSLVLKWCPFLTRNIGSPSFWSLVFGKAGFENSSELVRKCAQEWSPSQKSSVIKWIFTETEKLGQIDLTSVCRFLLNTIAMPIESVAQKKLIQSEKAFLNSAMNIVVESLIGNRLFKAIEVSPAQLLGIWIASRGKLECQSLSKRLVAEFNDNRENLKNSDVLATALKLYLKHPQWIDLSSVTARTFLMEASELFAVHFMSWKSSLDDELCEIIDSIRVGQFRLVKTLSDMMRKHPLIVLRKAKYIASLLEHDAFHEGPRDDELRGVVHGQGLTAPRDANLNGVPVRVSVRHWGYSYTEPIWAAFLDVMSSVPKEVLFGCGLSIGLLDLLPVYLKLLSVQLKLLSREKGKRLTAKLSELFSQFEKENPRVWRKWLGSKMEEGEVRHILMSCNFISPQQAIESIKSD